MDKPRIAAREPVPVELEAGKTYAWCACGRSANQPWCDGSHRETSFTPKVFTAEKDRKAFMCCCKATGNPGFCDGSHNSLEG